MNYSFYSILYMGDTGMGRRTQSLIPEAPEVQYSNFRTRFIIFLKYGKVNVMFLKCFSAHPVPINGWVSLSRSSGVSEEEEECSFAETPDSS